MENENLVDGFRLTASVRLTKEELAYLSVSLRPRSNADEATRNLIQSINDAARTAQTLFCSESSWGTRDHNEVWVTDVDTDLRLKAPGHAELQWAQRFERKGFLVRAFRGNRWCNVVRLGDFVCQINGRDFDEARGFSEALSACDDHAFALGLFRDREFLTVPIPEKSNGPQSRP